MKPKEIEQIEFDDLSSKDMYFSIIESLLFVSGEPLKLKEIADILECSVDFTEELMNKLLQIYENDSSRGIKLVVINDGYQLVTKPENSTYVQKLLKINTRQSLSQAALETLAIIAYKQPITRIGIDEIRGVKSDRAVLTLLEKNLIKEVGRLDVIGRPILYSTTDEFIKYFELEKLSNLPSLEELVKDFEDGTVDLVDETEEEKE